MNLLRRNWDAVFAFIHRERLYFLILILALSVIALHQNLYSTFSNIEVSSEVEKMKQFSDDFEKSLQSQAGLLKIFEAHPLAAVGFVLFISVFAGLFIGGLALLLLVGIIPRMMKWFEGTLQHGDPRWRRHRNLHADAGEQRFAQAGRHVLGGF